MKNILIVDDEFLIRYSLTQVLHSKTMEAISVTTGQDALDHISKIPFDLCCLDIHLPDISGFDVMKKLKEISPRTKIIMMTGGEVTPPMLEDIKKNAETLLPKPFDLFELKAFVQGILESDDEHVKNPLPVINQRRHERQPIMKRIAYSVSGRQEQIQPAEIVDISDRGICVMTTYRLPEGVLLKICNNKTEECTGTVRWSKPGENDQQCRAGIELMQGGGLNFFDIKRFDTESDL